MDIMVRKRRLDIRNVNKKIEEQGWHKLYKYEQDYAIKRYIKDCDRLSSEIVRKRDQGKRCVTRRLDVCDKKIRTFQNSQCCHGQRRGYYSSRRDLRNMYSGCANCNCYGYKDHDQGVTTHIIRTHGIDVWEEIIQGQSKRKPRIDEIKEIKNSLEQELERLNKELSKKV